MISDELVTFERKNRGERIQVAIREYAGRLFVDFRSYFMKNDQWFPTKRGITVQHDEIEALIGALIEAKDQITLKTETRA